MKYNALLGKLREFENSWPHLSPTGGPFKVVGKQLGNAVQYVTLRKRTDFSLDPDLDVVVDVGLIHGPCWKPRQGLSVEADDIDYGEERRAIFRCNSHRSDWLSSGLVSPGLPPKHLEGPATRIDAFPVEDFHVVTINFCPWTRPENWTDPVPRDEIGLLSSALLSPPFSPRSDAWPFDHLDKFCEEFREHVSLWIGHGLDTLPTLFRLFVAKHSIANWLLCGSLTRIVQPRPARRRSTPGPQ